MESKVFRFFLLMAVTALMAFQINSTVIKGKLKQVVHYLSGQKTNFFYDELGRLKHIDDPYGVTWDFTYSANYIYRVWKDPRGYTETDTGIEKAANHIDSVLGDNSVWKLEYDIEGNVLSQTYTPLHGKKRKPGKAEYFYSYNYYPTKWDSSLANIWGCMCDPRINLRKTEIGVNAKGDTIIYFTYRYQLDTAGKVVKRMLYYRTGQLYDSVGYFYY
jgi:hypothetical protein